MLTIRTLFWRGVFWVSSATFIGGVLLGLIAIYAQFGLVTMWLAVGALYVIHIGLQRRTGYYDPGAGFSGSGPALPAPGTRHITRSQRRLPGMEALRRLR
jgi:hypothetical protein